MAKGYKQRNTKPIPSSRGWRYSSLNKINTMDLIDNFDSHLDALEFLSDCEIGTSLDGEPILSFKKIAQKFRAMGYDPYEATEVINSYLAPLRNSRGVIVLYDID
jgi:hypothetical protein